jgi:hypothetical protein
VHFLSKLADEALGYFNLVVSLALPLGFPWDSHDRIRDMVWNVVDGRTDGFYRLIRVDLVEPMDAAILNALRAQHQREQTPGGSIRMIEVFSLIIESPGLATDQFQSEDVVIVCDCGGTGAVRATPWDTTL